MLNFLDFFVCRVHTYFVSEKQLQNIERREGKSLWFSHITREFFILQLRICSPLNWINFWTASSIYVILQIFGWIVKTISREGNKCFTFSILSFRISSSCLYCKYWFLWSRDSWFLSLHWEIFHVKQIVSPVYSWFLFYVLYFTGVTHSFLQIWENLFPLPIPLLLNLLLCWSIFFIKNTTTLTRKINDFANRSYYSIEYPTIQHMPSLHLCIQHLQINDDNLLRQQSINHMVQIDLPSTTYSIIYQQASHLPFPHKLILNLMWVLKFDCSDVGLFFPLGFDVQGWFTEE